MRNQTRAAILFLAPSFILMLLFFVGPILVAFFFAFTDMSLIGSTSTHIKFVGFKNFVTMFTDPNFRTSVIKTIIFLVGSAIIGQQILGFLLAYLMKGRKVFIKRVVGVCVLAGWVTPTIVAAFIWISYLNYEGTVNYIISYFGVGAISWLFAFPMISIIFANVWKGTAFSMMIFEAALGDVSSDVEEAALMDGANGWQRLRYIIIPMLKNTIVTNMILITLQTIGGFGLIYGMTGGGPGMATQILPIFMYKQAFVGYQLGYGTAIALFTMLIGIVASLLYVKLLKSEI
ncbi:MAG TPA: sugar ABC transporter permease [Victivallales bacterium]|nr:sugar ABC transporter permease [Victivallales bacterium]